MAVVICFFFASFRPYRQPQRPLTDFPDLPLRLSFFLALFSLSILYFLLPFQVDFQVDYQVDFQASKVKRVVYPVAEVDLEVETTFFYQVDFQVDFKSKGVVYPVAEVDLEVETTLLTFEVDFQVDYQVDFQVDFKSKKSRLPRGRS